MKRLAIVLVILGAMFSAHAAQAATAPAACSAGYVNLSFDDSPTQYTPVLLSTLKTNNLKATFFVVGDYMLEYPTYTKNVSIAGHQIANHTQSHADLTVATSPIHDLVTAQYLTIQQTGKVPEFYRPPYVSTNSTVKSDAVQLGLTEIIWTVDTDDWESPPTSSIVAAVKNAKAGDFVIMHDGYANTINAIPQIAADLKARGLCAGKIIPGKTTYWGDRSFDATVGKF